MSDILLSWYSVTSLCGVEVTTEITRGVKFINFVGEEYQVVKREREYQGCVEEYNLDKKVNN